MGTPKQVPTAALLVGLLFGGLTVTARSDAADSTDQVEAVADDSGADDRTEATQPSDDSEQSDVPGRSESDAGREDAGDDPQPADTTEAPTGEEPEAAVEQLTPSEVPVWSWVLAGLVLLGAIAWMTSRSGSTANPGANSNDNA